MTFAELGLHTSLLSALAELGYEAPSPIQEQAIPPALAGRDVLGCAQTGTGKTCAFAVPILQRLRTRRGMRNRPIRALVLTPTRELALQIQESFTAYGKHVPLQTAVLFGGVGQQPQVERLKAGVDILVATPGRLKDLYQQGLLTLDKIQIFVLDEADRMLDMGFIQDVRQILTWLPPKKQTLFFTATLPPEVRGLVDSLLHDPVRVAVNPVSSPVEIIEQRLYRVDRARKTQLLAALIQQPEVKNALVFTRTKHGANQVATSLQRAGVSAAAIHGNKSQTARQQALLDFKEGRIHALVATDIAARGIDVEDLSHVFNYNLPDVPETYVHRIGRTGRAGRGGIAISFCDASEQPLLDAIEKLLKRPIPEISEPVPSVKSKNWSAAQNVRKEPQKTFQSPAAKRMDRAERVERVETEPHSLSRPHRRVAHHRLEAAAGDKERARRTAKASTTPGHRPKGKTGNAPQKTKTALVGKGGKPRRKEPIRSKPDEIVLHLGRQKDSTEQQGSLMKPYYFRPYDD